MPLLVVFILLMVLTRYPFAGGALHFADASWAIFLLLGRSHGLQRKAVVLPSKSEAAGSVDPTDRFNKTMASLVSLLMLGWCIDLIAVLGTERAAYCFTPAYIGVFAAQSVLYACGYYFTQPKHYQGLVAATLLGWASAFLITNITFYYWSGHFEMLAPINYARAVSSYAVPYLLTLSVYVGVWSGLEQHLQAARLNWLIRL